jgi:hypothetical protein
MRKRPTAEGWNDIVSEFVKKPEMNTGIKNEANEKPQSVDRWEYDSVTIRTDYDKLNAVDKDNLIWHGARGWELVAVIGKVGIMKRRKQ